MEFKYVFTNIQGDIETEIIYKTIESDIHSVMQDFRHFLMAAGYHPDTIAQYIEAE